MNSKDALSQKALEYFRQGYNCAQSVVLTMFEHWDGENQLIPKIATAFGGGIGRCGSLCGALTGSIMAIGMKTGTNEPSPEKRLEAYELARLFYKRFEERHRTVLCRELIGYDLSNPEELRKAREAGVFEERCTSFIGTAIELLESFYYV